MVVGAFPAAKLGALLLKQISKPIANAVKHQAKSSPFFRTYICMPPAQFYNWCEVKSKMWILNLGKPVNIPVLNEAMAIELGANLLGEGIIFIIAAGVLIAEYSRSARKETEKENQKKQEMDDLKKAIQDVYFRSEQHAAQIREMMQLIGDLESRVVQKPWVPKKESVQHLNLPPKTPPPPPLPPQPSLSVGNDDLKGTVKTETISKITFQPPPPANLLLRSVHAVENEFWASEGEQRKPGVLILALNHIYKDVYRLPLSLS